MKAFDYFKNEYYKDVSQYQDHLYVSPNRTREWKTDNIDGRIWSGNYKTY